MRVQLPLSGAMATVDEDCPQDVLDALDKIALKVSNMTSEELEELKKSNNQSNQQS